MRFWMALTLLAFSSSVPALQSPTKERIYLELGKTRVTENGEPVIEVDGKCGAGEVLAFHLPEKGWFVVSVKKPSGAGFHKIGKLDGNRITFEVHDRRYEITSDQPVSPQTTSLDLWVINITSSTGKADADSKSISCATDFKHWHNTTLFRDEKK